jgi:hypothetical protein
MLYRLKKIVRHPCSGKRLYVVFFIFTAGSLCLAAELDKKKYIPVSEIKAGMKGYCLTCLKGTEPVKYNLEVLSIIHNYNPGRDTILVKCSDEEFLHAGVIAGCSGSPVYLDGRLAGAMSFGWPGSKDPIYGVTAIADMLETGQADSYQSDRAAEISVYGEPADSAVSFDFSKPINLVEAASLSQAAADSRKNTAEGLQLLPTPIFISGLPPSAAKQLNSAFDNLSFVAVSGAGGSPASDNEQAADANSRNVKLIPGASLVIPLVYGDISMAASGTVTEVVGDTVYGFGHSLFGYGPVDLPMATGQVHTIIANQDRSFKVTSPLQIVGALRADESSAITGRFGAQASMFDMTIEVNRYNDTQPRKFKCRVANHKTLTPAMINVIISSAAAFLGDLPPENNIQYQATVIAEQTETLKFDNISGGSSLSDLTSDISGAVRLLMNNPFKTVKIKSIDVSIKILPKDISAHIWSVQVSSTKVKQGDTVDVDVVLETVRAPKKNYSFKVKIPQQLPLGKYDLVVCGTSEYTRFLSQAASYRFVAQSFDSLIDALKDILSVKRDRLYCLLVLPPTGIVVEKAELADLPATKAAVLYDAKRSLTAQPHQNWIESSLQTGLLTLDRKNIIITVED